ncbi:hypothetical protein EDD17DRAFT_1503415 [Pisolithus thermaeus]|nr:hypothetical protein EDD17DRAFT_1503415 [Pisolithus thermaeus]
MLPNLQLPGSRSAFWLPPLCVSTCILTVSSYHPTSLPVSSHHPTQLQPTSSLFTTWTRCSAKKVTGGKAPRVGLQAFHNKKVKASTASRRPTPEQKATTNTLCVMCRDEADLFKCLVVAEPERDKLKADNVTLKCVTCHWKQNQSNPQPYFGFYSQGQPVLAHPPLIQGTFQHAISGHVASLPTALVHLHLDNLELGHPQVNVLDSYFQPYFSEKSYHFSHLPFNLTTEQSVNSSEKVAIDLTHSLSSLSRVVIFLTTHSDEERVDLFVDHLDGEAVAFKVSECLQVLLNPLTKIVQGADIIFYVCGSIVTVKGSFNDLKEAAQKFKPRSMILFDAQHLQLASTNPLPAEPTGQYHCSRL